MNTQATVVTLDIKTYKIERLVAVSVAHCLQTKVGVAHRKTVLLVPSDHLRQRMPPSRKRRKSQRRKSTADAYSQRMNMNNDSERTV